MIIGVCRHFQQYISYDMSWCSVVLVEKKYVLTMPQENGKLLSNYVVSNTLRHMWESSSKLWRIYFEQI
jgi:hypothetical protein